MDWNQAELRARESLALLNLPVYAGRCGTTTEGWLLVHVPYHDGSVNKGGSPDAVIIRISCQPEQSMALLLADPQRLEKVSVLADGYRESTKAKVIPAIHRVVLVQDLEKTVQEMGLELADRAKKYIAQSLPPLSELLEEQARDPWNGPIQPAKK